MLRSALAIRLAAVRRNAGYHHKNLSRPPKGGMAPATVSPGAVSEMGEFVMKLIAEKATTTELYSLSDISTTRQWNYELPTLTEKSRFTVRQPWNTSFEFREAFFETFPIFKDIDLSNIAISGGAVFDLLHKRDSLVADIDVFIVGDLPSNEGETLSLEEKVLKRAERFIDDIYDHLESFVANHNKNAEKSAAREGRMPTKILLSNYTNLLSANRNGPVLSFNVPLTKVPIQLVLSSHKTVSDLLRKVDLDCTAIAFVEGKELVFSPMAKFCYENACTVVTDIKGIHFEERLGRYFSEKGVDIVMPLLDVKKIPKRNLQYGVPEVIDLDSMAIVYSEVVGEGKIITSRLVRTEKKSATAGCDENESGAAGTKVKEDGDDDEGGVTVVAAGKYGGNSSRRAPKVKNAGTIVHENIIHLNHGLHERFQYHGEGKYLKDVLLPIPKLTDRMITNSYETVKERLRQGFKARSLNVATFEKYFTTRPTSRIVKDVLLAPIEEREEQRMDAENNKKNDSTDPSATSPTGDLRRSVPTVFDAKFTHNTTKYLDTLVHEQVAQTKEKLAALEKDYKAHPEKYRIVADNPFVTASTSGWYGKKYVKEPPVVKMETPAVKE